MRQYVRDSRGRFARTPAEGGGGDVKARLEYLRGELRAERISYGELAELQGLAEHIDPGDVELLEAAGVPEFPDDPEFDAQYGPHEFEVGENPEACDYCGQVPSHKVHTAHHKAV